MTTMYDLLVTFVGTPSNDIERLVLFIFAGASYIILLVSVPYIITVISQIFRR